MMNKSITAIPPVTDHLAAFVANLQCEALPLKVKRQVSLLAVDFFRAACAGIRTPWLAKTKKVFAQLEGAPVSSFLYHEYRTDSARAAYMNGVLTGSLDWDDSHAGALLHPGVVVWPAALAVGEMVHASGRELMAAVVAGYEVDIRVGLGIQPGHTERGFQATPTCGVFGAAAAAAKLLGLGQDGIRDALGIAASYAGGTAQFFLSGSDVKRLHAGKAAAGGVEAALLAKAGLSGPRDAIEGDAGFGRAFTERFSPDAVEKGLGTDYELMGVILKPHAATARLQAVVDASFELVEEGVREQEISELEIGLPRISMGRLTSGEPVDLQQAQLSAPYAVALALVLGPEKAPPPTLSLEDFQVGLDDQRVRSLARRARCVVDSVVDAGMSAESVPGRVSVDLHDGVAYERIVMHAKGCPANPMSRDEIFQRFRSAADTILPEEGLDDWLARVSKLESLASVHDLLGLRARPS